MKVLRFRNIIMSGLLFLLLAGCAPEEADLTPPGATVDGGIESPTTLTDVVLTGTMDIDAFITADATPITIALVVTQDNILGTWRCDVKNMIEGENIILVSATDSVGNTRLMAITIIVDLTGPATTILQYPEVAQAGSFNFAGTVDEAGSSVAVEVFDSVGVSTGISGVAAVDADIWNVDLTLGALADGDYTVTATGTDRLGNISATPAEQIINLAVINPDFTITLPTALPVVLADPLNVSNVLFAGSRLSLADLNVTSTSGTVGIINLADPTLWDTDVSALAAGNSVVTFDVNNGGTVRKVLVVRDQTPPTVVEWTSTTTSTVTVEFNESMNATTILPENLSVVDSAETIFNVLSVVSVNDRTFTFTTDTLPVAAAYNATLKVPLPGDCSIVDGCTVEDGRGNGLAATYIWRFNK